jgi:outer membrane protein assembly factor BamD (BamD/ComL family)
MRLIGTAIISVLTVFLCSGCIFSGIAGGTRDKPSLMSRAAKGRDDMLAAVSYKNVRNKSLSMVGMGPNEKIAQAAYTEGDALFREKKFKQAEGKYDKAAFRWPDSALEEDSMFMQAECQFLTDRYADAYDTYDNLLKKYTNSRHIDTISKRYFAMGDYWTRLNREHPHWPTTPNVLDKERPYFDTNGHARRCFEAIIENDSTGPLADDAIMQLANSYFVGGRYADAADYYEMLRHQYPDSDHQFNAHLLGLQCELNQYQGPFYDDVPLKNAEKLCEQLLTQFPDKLGTEREKVLEHRKNIEVQFAMRDMEIAEYYEKGKKNLAARQHYNSLTNKYPGTPLASEARDRLAALEGKPDREPNAFVKMASAARSWVPWTGKDQSTTTASSGDSPSNVNTTVAQQPRDGIGETR